MTHRVSVLIPVHNRREITLGCLRALQEDGMFERTEIIVVDDGSTDGTGEAIQKLFPNVTILRGDGNLWWTGAIVLGMKEALRRGAETIVWLNDDVHLRPGSLANLVDYAATTGSVAVGQVLSSNGGRYTGWKKTLWGTRAVEAQSGENVSCDSFPGNIVAFPRKVVEKVGLPDAETFPHLFADGDYGLRISASGFAIKVLGGALVDEVMVAKPQAASWLLDERPAGMILKALFKRTGNLNPTTYWIYLTRHWSVFGAVRFLSSYAKLFLSLGIKSVIPRRLLVRWFGERSIAWKTHLITTKRAS